VPQSLGGLQRGAVHKPHGHDVLHPSKIKLVTSRNMPCELLCLSSITLFYISKRLSSLLLTCDSVRLEGLYNILNEFGITMKLAVFKRNL